MLAVESEDWQTASDAADDGGVAASPCDELAMAAPAVRVASRREGIAISIFVKVPHLVILFISVSITGWQFRIVSSFSPQRIPELYP